MKKVLPEALLVVFFGLALSFAANGLSPRGLKLSRDYFPGPRSVSNQPVVKNGVNLTNTTSSAQPVQSALARLQQKGFQIIDDAQAPVLFQDLNYQNGSIIFIDARDEDHYHAGHIPGAYQLDHMYPEKGLGAVLPACNTAQQIVVYCGGGDCEKSEFTAEILRGGAAIPNNKIFVYAGGMADWQGRKLPVEAGERKSGQITNPTK